MTKVVILGGGVAGLSAAHELAERGYSVDVYEANTIAGGKARSVEVPDTATDGRRGLPGEHGFRFFPRFYKHVTDTMKRIPYGTNSQGVFDNLVGTTRIEMLRDGKPPLLMNARFPHSLADFKLTLNDMVDDNFGISQENKEFFAEKVWQIMTSCEKRRFGEYERIGWWEFIDADGKDKSEAYRNFFGHGLTRSLVAAQAKVASTKTVGDIFIQLLFDAIEPGISSDRVLKGPTNEVWIDPWLKHLASLGVNYNLGSKVVDIHCEGGTITGATIEKDGERIEVSGDYYIAAFPVEVMAEVLGDNPELMAADPTLANIQELAGNVAWMNGAQFYLSSDVPLSNGHAIYVDSPWALTSISQHQFWPDFVLSNYGDGKVNGILSVDISEWKEPGILFGKAARDCTRDEIKQEIWAQLQRSINMDASIVLNDDDLHHWYLDSDIVFDEDVAAGQLPSEDPQTLSAQTAMVKTSNREPLLINLVRTWNLRPKAHTGIPNLFLASDYVQTYTDLASMEGANEAARRAVNCIIDASGGAGPQCQLWNLHEPDILAPMRLLDAVRYDLGLPWSALPIPIL
ncbi:hypothetical protein IAD21_00021 [Abditibacteriota bacterium]|nr:hypothetical protein IAD21_00021 [Abditibacteriota bacterium]